MNISKHALCSIVFLLVGLVGSGDLLAQKIINQTQTVHTTNGPSGQSNGQSGASSSIILGNIQSVTLDPLLVREEESISLIPLSIKHGIYTTVGGGHTSNNGNNNNPPPDTCPMMYVDVELPFVQSCITSTATVNYCNHGTALAANVYVDVELDNYLTLDSSAIPYTALGMNVFRFQLDTVLTGVCDNFEIYVKTDCDTSILGDSHCINAHIYPDTLCADVWNDYLLTVDGVCNGSDITFSLFNQGAHPIIAANNLEYVIIEDHLLLHGGGSNGLPFIKYGTVSIGVNGVQTVGINQGNGMNGTYTTGAKLEVRDSKGLVLASCRIRDCTPATMNNSTTEYTYDHAFWNGSHVPYMDEACAINGQAPVQTSGTLSPSNLVNGNGNNVNKAQSNSSLKALEHENTTVHVAPNPFEDHALIKIDGPIAEAFSFRLYDVTGKLVQTKFVTKQREFYISRGDLLKGMYFYQVEAEGNQVATGKIMIK